MDMFNNKGGMAEKILLMLLGAFLGVISYLMYQNFLLVINVLIVIVIYAYLHLHYGNLRNNAINAIVKDINAIQANQKIPTGEKVSGYLEIQTALEQLYTHIKTKEQMRAEILNMVNSAASNMELEKLLAALMPKLLETSDSNWGAFYLVNNATNKLEIKASLGFSKNIYTEFDIDIGEGFIGETISSHEVKLIKNIPDDTIFLTRTFLGKIKPKNIMVVPIVSQERSMGVLALASLYDYTDEQMEIVDMIKYYIGAAIENSIIYERSKRLTNELQFQNKLIHDLNIELETKIHEGTNLTDAFLCEIAACAICILDKDLNISLWNKGAEIVLGYTSGEVTGKNISNIDISDNVSLGDYFKQKKYEKGFAKQTSERLWLKRKDGAVFFADFLVIGKYNDYEELNGYMVVIRDISEFKNLQDSLSAEKSLTKKLIALSDAAVIYADKSGMILFSNNKAAKLIYKGNSAGIDIGSKAFTMEGTNCHLLFEEHNDVEDFIKEGGTGLSAKFTSVYNKNIIEVTASVVENSENTLVIMKGLKNGDQNG